MPCGRYAALPQRPGLCASSVRKDGVKHAANTPTGLDVHVDDRPQPRPLRRSNGTAVVSSACTMQYNSQAPSLSLRQGTIHVTGDRSCGAGCTHRGVQVLQRGQPAAQHAQPHQLKGVRIQVVGDRGHLVELVAQRPARGAASAYRPPSALAARHRAARCWGAACCWRSPPRAPPVRRVGGEESGPAYGLQLRRCHALLLGDCWCRGRRPAHAASERLAAMQVPGPHPTTCGCMVPWLTVSASNSVHLYRVLHIGLIVEAEGMYSPLHPFP